jgi:radical SAM superfamily enzyme YgiQ (UPF0313 family)
MKVLLVTSPHLNHSANNQTNSKKKAMASVRYAQTFVPMGLLSIAGAAESVADIKIIDINKAINSRELPLSSNFYYAAASWILEFKPDLVGFMTESDSYHHLIRICQSIKAINPKVLTLLGGVFASVTHIETLREFQTIDFVMRGEAELAFSAFLDCLSQGGNLKEVGNLTFREGGGIVSNTELPLIPDLDALPFPDFSRIALEPMDDIWVEIGRGCPFKCNFCLTAPYWKRKHRIKSSNRIIQELNYIKSSYQRTDFNFTHDLFTTDRRWVLNFCQELAKSELNVTWTCSSRTDTIDEEQIYWLHQAGCRNIYFGVETGTPEMQAKIDKNLDLDKADYIIRKTKDSGIDVTVGFISGLPGESENSLRGTLKKAYSFLRIPGSTVHLFGYGPYRGSSVFEVIKGDLIFDENFSDFPFSEETHLENCKLMKEKFVVFSRYSRLKSYEGLDVEVIRAAEEYLPILSTIRPLILSLDDHGVDPLYLLTSWTKWIKNRNRTQKRFKTQLYSGTIKDFLIFLRKYIQLQNISDSIINEMIDWELMKDQFRSREFKHPVIKRKKKGSKSALYTNPSLCIKKFDFTNKFLPENPNNQHKLFAFYARQDNSPIIVGLEPFVQTILDITKQGATPEQITKAINVFNKKSQDSASNTRKSILGVIGKLKEMELLLEAN